MNYTLRNLGDGFSMFDGAELIKDYVSEDYLVMSSYAAMFGGVDANGLPHLSSANSPLASYPGYLLNYEKDRCAPSVIDGASGLFLCPAERTERGNALRWFGELHRFRERSL